VNLMINSNLLHNFPLRIGFMYLLYGSGIELCLLKWEFLAQSNWVS